jgi:hypothetical protein
LSLSASLFAVHLFAKHTIDLKNITNFKHQKYGDVANLTSLIVEIIYKENGLLDKLTYAPN